MMTELQILQNKVNCCTRAQYIIGSRAEYYLRRGDHAMSQAYSNAATMLSYALAGAADVLEQFDPYTEEDDNE
jgi:hypothetical protein